MARYKNNITGDIITAHFFDGDVDKLEREMPHIENYEISAIISSFNSMGQGFYLSYGLTCPFLCRSVEFEANFTIYEEDSAYTKKMKSTYKINEPFITWTGSNLKDMIDFTGKHENFDKWFPAWEDYEKYVEESGKIFRFWNFGNENPNELKIGDMLHRNEGGEVTVFHASYNVNEIVEDSIAVKALKILESKKGIRKKHDCKHVARAKIIINENGALELIDHNGKPTELKIDDLYNYQWFESEEFAYKKCDYDSAINAYLEGKKVCLTFVDEECELLHITKNYMTFKQQDGSNLDHDYKAFSLRNRNDWRVYE